MTHVLLPVGLLVRRADAVEVVGAALTAKASGLGAGPVAGVVGRPVTTVRGWLRRFGRRVEQVRAYFVRLLVAVGLVPVVPVPAGSGFADAVAAVSAAFEAVRGRFAVVGVTPWRVACAVSGGRLLALGWPPESINTSSPWQALM